MSKQTSKLTYGDMTLDPVAQTVQVGAETIHLMQREFQLLACLFENAGQPMSRRAIKDRLWAGRVETSNVIDVYVNYLRKKIPGDHIATVRGVGYMLKAA